MFATGSGFDAEREFLDQVSGGDAARRATLGRLLGVLEEIARAGMSEAEPYFHDAIGAYRTRHGGMAAFFRARGPWGGRAAVEVVMTARYDRRAGREAVHEEVRRRLADGDRSD